MVTKKKHLNYKSRDDDTVGVINDVDADVKDRNINQDESHAMAFGLFLNSIREQGLM